MFETKNPITRNARKITSLKHFKNFFEQKKILFLHIGSGKDIIIQSFLTSSEFKY